MFSHGRNGVGHSSSDLSRPEQRQVVLGIPDRDRIVWREVHFCQYRAQPGALRDARRQHHHGSPVSHDLTVQSQHADHLDHGRGGVLTVDGQQHLSPPERHPPLGQRVIENTVHWRRQPVGSPIGHCHRTVFEHQRVEMIGDVREFPRQFHPDPARDKHHHQTVLPSRVDRLQSLRRNTAPRCESAVQIDRRHLKKRHRPSHPFAHDTPPAAGYLLAHLFIGDVPRSRADRRE